MAKVNKLSYIWPKQSILKASEQIINDEVCTNYAKSLDLTNWQDLFNEAWLKVREREISGAEIKSYRSYFYQALTTCRADKFRHQANETDLHAAWFEVDEEYQDIWGIESEIYTNG